MMYGLVFNTQYGKPVPKEFIHLVGVWQWESSKFFTHSQGQGFRAKYKTPESENHTAKLEITKDGRLITYINAVRKTMYFITNYDYTEENTNSPIFYHYRLTLLKRNILCPHFENTFLFYQWENEN